MGIETDTKKNKYTIKTVETAMGILDHLLSKGKSVSVTDIGIALKINTNMAHRLMQTMTSAGYLVQNPETSKYSPSLKMLQLGRIALNNMELRNRAFPYMESLWREIKVANINLSVLQGKEIVVIDRIDSGGVPRTFTTPGKSLPAHASSMGKILLSELIEEEIIKITGTGNLPRFTQHTIPNYEQLLAELEKVREEGVAWDIHEQIPNSCCVAAAIRNEEGKIIGAISLSSFEIYLSRDRMNEFVPQLQIAASHISFAMGFNNS